MYYGFNCMFIFLVLDERILVDIVKFIQNQVNDVEDICRDGNYFEFRFCGFVFMF